MSYTALMRAGMAQVVGHFPHANDIDVAALQFLYGAQTHNETDTVYYWNDPDIPFAATIWDSEEQIHWTFRILRLGMI